jgi:hypothetical protein
LASQLANNFVEYAKALTQQSNTPLEINIDMSKVTATNVTGVVINDLHLKGFSNEDAFIRLIIEPLKTAYNNDPKLQVVILVDGLDEANMSKDQFNIVSMLSYANNLPSDQDPYVSRLILEAAMNFSSSNPRELKRFVNVFRFQYFIRAARKSRGLPVTSLEQLTNWIILSLKWPQVIQWLQWNSNKQVTSGDQLRISHTPAAERLRTLERIGKMCKKARGVT